MSGNRRDPLEIVSSVGAVLTDGHFVYTSGRHGSAYVNKDEVYFHTEETSDICFRIAEQFAHLNIETVAAPALGGIALIQWVAYYLSRLTGRKVFAVYAEKEEEMLIKGSGARVTIGDREITLEKGQELVIKTGKFVFKRGGANKVKGRRVLVLEDVLTTGGSARKVINATRTTGGEVVALAVLCDRADLIPKGFSDIPDSYAVLRVPLEALTEEECQKGGPCSRGVPINTEVGKGKEYLALKAKSGSTGQ